MKRMKTMKRARNMRIMQTNTKSSLRRLFLPMFLLLLITSPLAAEVHIVKIKDFNYHPADLTIRQGDTVLWINEMPYGHWVISGVDIRHDNNFFSPLLLKDHKFSHTFKDAIVQDYYCPIHSMQGRITVLEAEGSASDKKAPEKKKRRRRRR